MITAVATGAEPEPPPEETPTEASSPSEVDGPGLIKSDGGFAKFWNQQSFVGPGVLVFPGSRQESKLRLPADFEKHQAIVLAGGWLVREAPDVFSGIVTHMKPEMRFVFLVSSSRERDLADRLLAEHGPKPDTARFLTVPTDTGWVRDFGPMFVCEAPGGFHAIDAAYDKPGRDRDDAATRAIADRFQKATAATPLRWQGGNLLSNGWGLLVTTTQSINANIECGHDFDTVTRFLKRRLGVKQLVALEPLQGETTGHIDMYACFTSPDTILVGEYDKSVDPRNAAILDRNAARLTQIHFGSSAKLKVIRIPMPTNQNGVWRSFTNVVFANGTLLVPTYPDVDPSGGDRALAIYRRLLPDWKVVAVDASAMARHNGGLRCVTLYVPDAGQPESGPTATDSSPDTDR